MSRGPGPLDEARAARIREAREILAEFEAHVAHRIDDLVAQGLSEADARARALAEFGDAERLQAESQAIRASARRRRDRASRLEAIRQDLAFALRQLARSPGFALTGLLTLTLGIGATATIVTVVDGVVLEPLPFHEPDRIVFGEMLTPERAPFPVSEPTYLDWRERARSFDGLAATVTTGATLRGHDEPRSVDLVYATYGLLDALGREPVLGRMFTAAEDASGAEAAVALLSNAAWQSDFGGDPTALGTELDLDGTLHQVIGVMPPAVELITGEADVFVPLGPDPDMDGGDHYLTVVGRLANGVTLEGAREELAVIQRRLGETHAVDQGWSATLQPSESVLIGDDTVRAGWILLAAGGLLLLMACVNVSNLLMVRATARRTEMGLRAALGASRGRLVRQLFAESGVLASLGGVLGLAFASFALPLVRPMGEGRIPRLDGAALDGTALLACILAIAGAALMCGLAPIVQLRAQEPARSIGSGPRGSSDPGSRLRSFLVAAQIAMSVVLLAGTGLLFRSFVELASVDPGFEAEGALAVRLDMPDRAYTWEERGEIFPRLRNAVASLPGVVAVGATAVDPFSGMNLANFVARVDRMPDRAADFTPIAWRVVTPGFFEAMGMDLIAGRTFSDSDGWDGLPAIVIGEGLARTLYGSEDPIDRVLVWGNPDGSRLRIVGVVEELRDVELAAEPYPIVYRPHRQIPWAAMTLVARVEGDPASVSAGIRSRIREAVPGLPIPEVRPLAETLDRAVAQPRFNVQLLSSFAAVGLLLAVVGVYGLTAFDVRRRFREIGIRISLGAEPDALPRMIVLQRMRLSALGVGVGLVAAWVLTRWIEAQLYGISASDPLTWVVVVGVITIASALAAYLPARFATRVDPCEVLSVE